MWSRPSRNIRAASCCWTTRTLARTAPSCSTISSIWAMATWISRAATERHLRSQTYAAELAADQAAVFDLFRAGTTWFFNQAIASQLDRYRHHVPVETYAGLSYAVSVARKDR